MHSVTSAPRAVPPQPLPLRVQRQLGLPQLAAALWRRLTGHPASRRTTLDPGASRCDRRRRAPVSICVAVPQALDDVDPAPALVVTVCDQAHEEVAPGDDWLHWSVPDPVPVGTSAAFDATVAELKNRIQAVIGAS
jgi:hypothetical protein